MRNVSSTPSPKETLCAPRPEVVNKNEGLKGLWNPSPAVRPVGFTFLLCCGMLISWSDQAGHESRPLGRRERRIDQVDSQRSLL